MTGIKEYGKFLSELNQSGKLRKIIKIESTILKNIEYKTKNEIVRDSNGYPIIKPSNEKVKELNTIINNLSNVSPTERDQFNDTITEAMKFGYSIISKQTKTSKYTYLLRGTILDTVLNNEYTGIITANGILVEIERKWSREITDNMIPPKEIFNIAPKFGKLEHESYNHMIEFVMNKKCFFFSKKRGVGYSYGYSKDVIAELINSDYFAIITTKKKMAEFVRKDSRKIITNMQLPNV